MNIPDFQKLMHPFLEAIKDGRVYSTEQIVEMLRVHFSLTMDDMKVKVPNGNQSLFRNRIDWASNHLHQAGLVASFLKGYYQITEAGNLHQNARYLAPKRKVNCNELHKYNQQKGAICIFITIDIDREQRLLRYRNGEKSGYLGAKSRNLGLLKMRVCIKLERQSGAKRMR